jgi:hypothetical protein
MEPKGRPRRLPPVLEAIGFGLGVVWVIALVIVWTAGESGGTGWWASEAGASVSSLAFVIVLVGLPVGLFAAGVIVLFRFGSRGEPPDRQGDRDHHNPSDLHPDQRSTSGRLAELLELRNRGEISDEEWMALRSEALGAKQLGP